MLNWCTRFNIFCFLDNNSYEFEEPGFECILAAGCKQSVSLNGGEALQALQGFSDKSKDWLFGHFGYELLSQSNTHTSHTNEVEFGDGFFFTPEVLIRLKQNMVEIQCIDDDPTCIYNEIHQQPSFIKKRSAGNIDLKTGITATEYKEILGSLKKHILRGDCYEINFCQSFYVNDITIDPLFFYQKLSAISPNPFGAFYKLDDKYCLCASPERFLKKKDSTLISQPIKGTSKRDITDSSMDIANRHYLLNSDKEKTENVMVVDLVRNDMSKVCRAGTVHVKELFGIYSFPQVHQMISTIAGEVDPEIAWTNIIKACFPMGSMTGAPKKKVIELIERYEQFPRGLFSGSIGYIDPAGDFDFNVVIRSLMYDETKKLVSFKAGGGITFNSDVDEEYEESLLKVAAIIKVLKDE
ncbi:anthranilate synthase component I family protein [soil metagenome]